MASTIPKTLQIPPLLFFPSRLLSSKPPTISRPRQSPTFLTFSFSSPPIPSSFAGWDDLDPLDDPDDLDPFRHFLTSVGIHDRKHAFLFSLGFLSALALSRVRVSTMAVFPLCVLVFAVGLSVGFAKGGGVVGREGRERRERGGGFVGFLDELDVKFGDLKGGLERIVASGRVEMGEIRRYVEVVESLRLEALASRRCVEEDSFDGDCLDMTAGFDDLVIERKATNQKSSRKRNGMSLSAFDFVRFVEGLFKESFTDSSFLKTKQTAKREVGEKDKGIATNTIKENVGRVEGDYMYIDSVDGLNCGTSLGSSIDWRAKKSEASPYTQGLRRNVEDNPEGGDVLLCHQEDESPVSSAYRKQTSYSRHNDYNNNDMLAFDEKEDSFDGNFNNTGRVTRISQSKSHNRDSERRRKYHKEEAMSSRAEDVDAYRSSKSESSLKFQTTVQIHNQTHSRSHVRQNGKPIIDQENFESNFSILNDQVTSSGTQSRSNLEAGMPSNSTASTDDEFSRKMEEATDLLRRARECLKTEVDEELAEIMLYKSARLLSAAATLKPMSLLAVGQLGNTFLLHGELKLKRSREIRSLLSRRDSMETGKWHRLQSENSNDVSPSKDQIASSLIDICEECEQLLVEAGRNYKTALSINGEDVRALYNWGLALYFRAELIADIGPEAAFDADKVYLAAIDKFSAMTSRSNTYAPDALFRWGLALQQRSHLCPPYSKEKMKLLKQARSLFEDVLSVDSASPLVREALLSCLSEINYSRQLN